MATNNACNQVLTSTRTITNSEMKSFGTTAITLVAAPGAGYIVAPLFVYTSYLYGGTNAFTGGGTVGLYYGNKTYFLQTMYQNSALIGTTSRYVINSPTSGSSNTTSPDNLDLTIANSGADFGGNAANDNTMTIKVFYMIIPV